MAGEKYLVWFFVLVRGINKSDIFKDDEDRTRFLERFGQKIVEGKCTVYEWVLMSV